MYNNTVRINDTDSVGYGLFNVADSFIRYEGDIAKAKLSILYLICRVFIPVSNDIKTIKIDQEIQEL